ncbi:MAG: hypothetical protein MHM6MM_002846 [Cercozoa sp. M6MM]
MDEPLVSSQARAQQWRAPAAVLAVTIIGLGALLGILLGTQGDTTDYFEELGVGLLLPETFLPFHYDLYMEPDLEQGRFQGTVAIDLDISTPFRAIALNSIDLTIQDSTLECEGSKYSMRDVKTNKELQAIALVFSKSKLEHTQCKLTVQFAGVLRDDALEGFYLSSYKDNGETRLLATTQFEPSAARKAFPCMDQPDMKAKFSISVKTPDATRWPTVLSNMPTQAFEDDVRRFETTPPMSTYLIAFIVCDFDYISTKAGSTDVRVFHRRGEARRAKYALKAAAKQIEFYSEYYDFDYADMLPKLDLVPIPDFAAGAMENYGLMTFSETALLADEGTSSASELLNVARVVAHELVHQWFGNLVTPVYWNDLWLKESFARYFEDMGVDASHPEFGMSRRKVTRTQSTAFDIDSLAASPALRVPLDSLSRQDDVAAQFDSVRYEKGASVLDMLSMWFQHLPNGHENAFRDALRIYLKRHQFAATTTEDLIAAFQEVLGDANDMATLLHNWCYEPGFPAVTLVPVSDKTFVTRQQRYVASGQSKGLWHVPLRIQDGENVYFAQLEETPTGMAVADVALTEPVLNTGAKGYFRVNYAAEQWLSVRALLRNGKLSDVDAASHIGNLLAFALSASFDSYVASPMLLLDTLLDTSAASTENGDFLTVWDSVIPALQGIEMKVTKVNAYKQLQHDILRDASDRLGWSKAGSTQTERMMRAMVQLKSVRAALPEAVQEGSAIFEAANRQVTEIEADIREASVVAAVVSADRELFDFLTQEWLNSQDAAVRGQIMRALCFTVHADWLLSTMETAIDRSSGARSTDIVTIMSTAPMNRGVRGELVAWEFMQNNWDELCDRFCRGSFTLARIIRAVCGTFDTRELLADFEAFFVDRDAGTAVSFCL